jgi:hypothetical protein
LREKPERLDPELVLPLREKGLLHNIEPEDQVDAEATKQLATALSGIISSGALDELAAQPDAAFHELSMSRLGYYGEPKIAESLFKELKKRGLAKKSRDGVSIPMHSHVRVLILVLLAQILRPKGKVLGMNLIPATDRPELMSGLTELLNIPSLPSAGHVVSSDLETVGVNLSLIPLDEVLDYRQQHKDIYQRYARNVRSFVQTIGTLPNQERKAALEDRKKELADLANELRKMSGKAWKKPASFALSGAGAVWTAVSGDPFGALFALGALAAGLGEGNKTEAGAFSFLFSAPGQHRYV